MPVLSLILSLSPFLCLPLFYCTYIDIAHTPHATAKQQMQNQRTLCVCIWHSLPQLNTHTQTLTHTSAHTHTNKYLYHIFSHLSGFWFLVFGFWLLVACTAHLIEILNKPIKIKITVALCHAPCPLHRCQTTDSHTGSCGIY